MAGHSKFKNIMYRKGAQDKKRSKIFSKLSKEITVAAKLIWEWEISAKLGYSLCRDRITSRFRLDEHLRA